MSTTVEVRAVAGAVPSDRRVRGRGRSISTCSATPSSVSTTCSSSGTTSSSSGVAGPAMAARCTGRAARPRRRRPRLAATPTAAAGDADDRRSRPSAGLTAGPACHRVRRAAPGRRAGDDLVVDGAGASAQSSAVGSPPSPGPNSSDLVAGAAAASSPDVDDELVHADPPGDGARAAAEPDRADVGGVARARRRRSRAGTSDQRVVGRRSCTCGRRRRPGRPARRLTSATPRPQRHRRAQPEVAGPPIGHRRQAVDRDARAGPGRSAPPGG